MKIFIVTTTINKPTNLIKVAQDSKKYKHDYEIVVVGDKKTLNETKLFCDENEFVYLDCESQIEFLKNHFPNYVDACPWNCIQRRNIGFLYAYYHNADVVLSIDDDNYFNGENLVGEHISALNLKNGFAQSSKNGWLNPACHLLVYHRGFSFKDRCNRFKNESTFKSINNLNVVVNAGLWTGDPDVDAVTRIAYNPKVNYINTDFYPIIPASGTMSPFNSQNTAIKKEVIPAYCMIVGVGRYNDIIPSYFVKKIADHLNHQISYGLPIVHQERNKHDLHQDLKNELLGMKYIDLIVEWINNCTLTKSTYYDCIKELLFQFNNQFLEYKNLPKDGIDFFQNIVNSYFNWIDAFK